jgi:type II secretory pathway predicted ATPase ExeA
MYQEHFGFQNPPFEDRLAQDGEVFIGAKQRGALANIKIALGTRDAAIVLTGAPGVGKTALAAHSLRTTTTRLALAWVGLAPLTGHELLEHLLTEFGFSPYKCSRVERLQMWRQFLNEMSLTETRVGILIEKAESFGTDVLQTLESLTAAAPNGCPGANVILTGDPALREILRAPGLESLRQRIRLSQALEELDANELDAFLDYKFSAAAGNARALFAPGAVAMLHHFSAGRIRVVKNLCETALTIAAVRKETQLTPRLIAQVAVGLFGLEPSPSAAAANAMPREPAASVERADGSTEDHEHDSGDDVPTDVERAVETDAEAVLEADAEAAVEADVEADRIAAMDVDVPTLTDSVEIAADPLLEDVAASKRQSAGTAVSQTPADALGNDAAASELSGSDGDFDDGDGDEGEPLDPQQDALQAFANAKALEDISNSMAETLFGDAELAQLGATLAVANGGVNSAAATASPQASPSNGDASSAVPAAGATASRFA